MSEQQTTISEYFTEPVTIERLWKIYTEAKLIPMLFKPTGETVYVTLQFRDWIEQRRYTHERAADDHE